MMRFYAIVVSLLLLPIQHVQSMVPLPQGMLSSLFGDMVGNSDFELNLQPPQQNLQDITESLDAIMQLEKMKQHAATGDFVKAKQFMLNGAKKSIHDIVAAAFEPVFAKLK
jgi:hypothetical protein